MGQSLILAIPIEWTLVSIEKCLSSAMGRASLLIKAFEDQLEIHISDDVYVIITEISDRTPDIDYDLKDDYVTDDSLDEQFKRDVVDLRLFSIRHNSVDLTRWVLRHISEEIVKEKDIAWIDTEYDNGVVSARDFIARTDEDPNWDWRKSPPPKG